MRLWKNTSGGVAVIFALSVLPIILVIGLAIDMQRMLSVKNRLIVTLDTATLAAANLKNPNDETDTIASFMAPQMQRWGVSPDDITVEINAERSLRERQVDVIATARVKLIFMPLIGRDYATVSVRTVAKQSIPSLEISMVLDISSSMNGNRLTNLKSASQGFVDKILDQNSLNTTSINIVPFGGTVNIAHLFDKFAVQLTDPDTVVDPTEGQYDIGQRIEDKAFRFSQGDNCVEVAYEDYDAGLLPAFGRSQVPHFWRWWNFQPWCPGEKSAIFLNSNNRAMLKSRLANMVLSDGTGMDIGALWGFKSLSPNFRGDLGGDFPNRPLDFDEEDSRKIMIIMTDGEITEQSRPEDYSRLNVHTNRSDNKESNVKAKGNTGNNKNLQRTLSRGSASHPSSRDSAVGRFRRVCEKSKENGITIFTIGFQIKSNSIADRLLEECASAPNYYYHVESLDIDQAFSAIASQITELRITQ